jgi:carbonic anhydrase
VATPPAVARWLRSGGEARRLLEVPDREADDDTRFSLRTWRNVVDRMEHLKTLPSVQAAMVADRLQVYGWVYEIETGDVRAWKADQNNFVPFPAEPCLAWAVPSWRRQGSSTCSGSPVRA